MKIDVVCSEWRVAYALSKTGLNISLIDKKISFPNLFSAKKIEADRADSMIEFGITKLHDKILTFIR